MNQALFTLTARGDVYPSMHFYGTYRNQRGLLVFGEKGTSVICADTNQRPVMDGHHAVAGRLLDKGNYFVWGYDSAESKVATLFIIDDLMEPQYAPVGVLGSPKFYWSGIQPATYFNEETQKYDWVSHYGRHTLVELHPGDVVKYYTCVWNPVSENDPKAVKFFIQPRYAIFDGDEVLFVDEHECESAINSMRMRMATPLEEGFEALSCATVLIAKPRGRIVHSASDTIDFDSLAGVLASLSLNSQTTVCGLYTGDDGFFAAPAQRDLGGDAILVHVVTSGLSNKLATQVLPSDNVREVMKVVKPGSGTREQEDGLFVLRKGDFVIVQIGSHLRYRIVYRSYGLQVDKLENEPGALPEFVSAGAEYFPV